MNQTGQSAFNQARIEWAIRLRFSPMPRLDPEVMSSQLNAFRIGELRVVGKTWECQMERDGELAVNAVKRCSDLAALPYQVVSDGSPDGDKHAAALTYFYKHARVTKALDQDSVGGISDLLRQMASAHSYYYSAHEMLLRVDNPAGKEVTAEFRHTPVWFFESRRGYLAYLKHIFDVYGQPCVQGEWLTCVGEGWMRPLSIAFCMKAFSLRDWNVWCARYASGFLEGIVDEAPGTTGWEEAKSALQTMANDGAVVHSPKVILKFLEQAARSGMPFKELVDLVNSLYAKCYRGVDLATGSKSGGSSAGAGGGSSNVVGASVQSEESGIYLASDALWATGYLNDRVDRPIIRYLFNQEPRAAISVSPPPDDTTDEDLEVVKAMVPLGWKIALKDVYKRFRWEAPADGEPCLQAPVPLGPPKPGDGGSAPGVSGAVPSAAPKTADETEETTQAAQEDETAPIGAGADPASLGKPQTFAPEMPDPQVDAAGFWSSAGAALRSIFGPFVRKPMDRMTDGTLPALATAIPNQSDRIDSPRPSEATAGQPPKVTDQLEEASRKKLASATHEDMAHAAAKVKALLQITDPDHFAARAKEVMGEWDSVTANTLMVSKAADALAPVIGAAYAQGLQRPGNAVANMNDNHDPDNGRFTSGPSGDKVERSNEDDQSRRTAQSPLVAAKNHVGGGAETSPGHDASRAERLARVATEQERLTHWSQANNRVISSAPERFFGGREHDVSFDPASGRVTKATRPDHQLGYGHAFHDDLPGATPSEYLDRAHLANQTFGDDIRLEGIVRTPKGPSIVTSQPFIRGHDSTSAEIDSYMAGKGFEKVGEGAFHHPGQGLLVHDMHPRNVKTDQAGIVHPIDPIIQRVKPRFLDKVKPLL